MDILKLSDDTEGLDISPLIGWCTVIHCEKCGTMMYSDGHTLTCNNCGYQKPVKIGKKVLTDEDK